MTAQEHVKPEPITKPVAHGKVQPQKQRSKSELFALKLLEFESQVRELTDTRELAAHLCNSSREVIAFNQSFFGSVNKGRSPFTLECVSSIPSIDRNSPFKIRLEKVINQLIHKTGGRVQQIFDLPKEASELDGVDLKQDLEYLWTPQFYNDELVGGFIAGKNASWSDTEKSLVNRLTQLYGHARCAINGSKHVTPKAKHAKKLSTIGLLALVAIGCLPVPISALAPMEVSAANPYVLTAPFDGVVRSILPSQGQNVSEGEIAVTFDDVHLSNEMRLAERRMTISEANLQQISQSAISDYRIKRDIEVARAELELAKTEFAYTRQLNDQSQLAAPVSGIAMYSAKSDWEGKPVSAGEAIMSIANPEDVELTLHLPVKDSLVLEKEAKVRVFLDSDPLNPLDAVVTEADYSAAPDKQDIYAYRLVAKITGDDVPTPRIGTQGTAQVYGEKASLAYVIFRRPYSALRQLTGW